MDDRTLYVAVSGLDQRQRKSVAEIFRERGRGRYVLADEFNADISLLDMDAPNAEMNWLRFNRNYPDRPAIVFSLHPVAKENALFLRKPIGIDDLLNTLEKQRIKLEQIDRQRAPLNDWAPAFGLSRGISKVAQRGAGLAFKPFLEGDEDAIGQCCGTREDVDADNLKTHGEIYYASGKFLISLVLKAGELARTEEVAVRIDLDPKPLIISPGANLILSEINEHMLRSSCLVPVDASTIKLQKLGIEEFIKLKQLAHSEGKLYSYDTFCWNMALWSSRGRLPEDTDPNAPIYIRFWPNLTRLTLTPHAMRIAALWSKQPRSLFNTAEVLRIPQRYVFAFYSAAHSLNLVGISRRAVDFTFTAEPVQASRYRAVLSRLLNRMHLSH